MFTYEYPHPAVTTDCVIFGYDIREGLSVLLVERGIEPYRGRWAFPGGFRRRLGSNPSLSNSSALSPTCTGIRVRGSLQSRIWLW